MGIQLATWNLECHKSLQSDLQILSAPTNAQCHILHILLLIYSYSFFSGDYIILLAYIIV